MKRNLTVSEIAWLLGYAMCLVQLADIAFKRLDRREASTVFRFSSTTRGDLS